LAGWTDEHHRKPKAFSPPRNSRQATAIAIIASQSSHYHFWIGTVTDHRRSSSSDYEATVAIMEAEKTKEQEVTVVKTEDTNNGTKDDDKKPRDDDETKEGDNNKSHSADDDDDDDNKDDTSSDDDGNEDSDTDFSPTEDPEVLLIKATALKEEGNNYFKQKDYEKASRSYRRGTNTLKPLNKRNTGDDQVKALLVSLQTNLSMMCFKLDKHKQSSQIATAALKIDATNVKAKYRRALARRKLGEHDEARDDLREALKTDPSNMAVKKELASLKKEMEESKKSQRASMQKAFSKGGGGLLYDHKETKKKNKQEEERLKKKQEEEVLKKRKADWEDECVKRMAKGEDALSFEEWEKERLEQKGQEAKQKAEEEKRRKEENKKARAAAKQEEEQSDSDEELTEKELAQLRGYKKTADGRVTSYFTRELSSDESNLIGDIQPQKLVPTASSHSSDGSGKGNASAWNHAGTWEEKDTTEWCHESLTKRLKETKAEAGSLVAVVAEVEDMTGDASVAIVGGKKRYIFDFHCKLKYEVTDPDTDDVIAKGSLGLPDICSTHHEEMEVSYSSWTKTPGSNFEQVASDCRLGLCTEVRESVKLWVNDFNTTY
jgi:tetratricopeptide (TPR) repeat protein